MQKDLKNVFELKTLEDYSDEALLNELRRVASELHGQRLTHERFNELARVHSTTVRYRFGSWKNALDIAGINETIAPRAKTLSREDVINVLHAHAKDFPNTPVTQVEIAKRLGVNHTTISKKYGKFKKLLEESGISPVPLGRRYTEEECFENIINLWTHYGRQPHFAELKKPPSKVGSKAYVLRWGGWRASLGAFIKHVNRESSQVPILMDENREQINSLPQKDTTISRSISLSLRYKVLCRDRFKCVICGRSPAKDMNIELHIDHIVPWSKGGQNTEQNLRTLCFDCNLGKGAKNENE